MDLMELAMVTTNHMVDIKESLIETYITIMDNIIRHKLTKLRPPIVAVTSSKVFYTLKFLANDES